MKMCPFKAKIIAACGPNAKYRKYFPDPKDSYEIRVAPDYPFTDDEYCPYKGITGLMAIPSVYLHIYAYCYKELTVDEACRELVRLQRLRVRMFVSTLSS